VPVTNESENKLCFMAYGDAHGSPMHNAITDNWFMQVQGAKTWRVMKPNVGPYLKPRVTGLNPSTGARLEWLPDSSPIPYVDMTSEAGDLLFFPAFWWHSVRNVKPGFQFGCGFRPQISSVAGQFRAALFPPLGGPALNLYLAHLPATGKAIWRRVIAKVFPNDYEDYWWKHLNKKYMGIEKDTGAI